MKQPELLAPAASPEGALAAIKNGADAVFLGLGTHNARVGAKNFTPQELRETSKLARYAGVRIYVTLNTLISDRELEGALAIAKEAQDAGADAILVQDLGLVSLLREALPDMELHASTQMSVMNASGANAAFGMGMKRVVAARELALDSLKLLCRDSRAEVECFVHGALCFCYSGQCYMSSVIGGRSGNRGACAQPCRLPYGFGERGGEYPLSLKDLSLASHLEVLRDAGATSLKIEGRMRRPEYAAIATRVFRNALDGGREPSDEELRVLRLAFSRGGFTDGYLTADKSDMLGVRDDTQTDTQKLFAAEKRFYDTAPLPRRIGVRFACKVEANAPTALAAVTDDGIRAYVTGAMPEAAASRALSAAEVTTQLYKTGGTPYICNDARAAVGDGLYLPVAELNSLRRAALDAIDAQRTAQPQRRYNADVSVTRRRGGDGPGSAFGAAGAALHAVGTRADSSALRDGGEFAAAVPQGARDGLQAAPVQRRRAGADVGSADVHSAGAPAVTAQLFAAEQLSRRLIQLKPDMIILPIGVLAAAPERFVEAARSCRLAAALPRVLHDAAWGDFLVNLDTVRQLGVSDAIVENIGHAAPAAERGFALHGGFGLNVYNSRAVAALRDSGFASATLSFELSFAEMRDIDKPIPCGIIAYGRLPLMITEQCIAQSKHGRCRAVTLVDRKNVAFPVVCAEGCKNVILNSKKLWLADKLDRAADAGVSELRLYFTTENAKECELVLERYRGTGIYEPNDFTRQYL